MIIVAVVIAQSLVFFKYLKRFTFETAVKF